MLDGDKGGIDRHVKKVIGWYRCHTHWIIKVVLVLGKTWDNSVSSQEDINAEMYDWYGGFPGGSVVKILPARQEMQQRGVRSLGRGRCLGGGHGNPLQCSCLENPMDRGAWRATPWGHKESDTAKAA